MSQMTRARFEFFAHVLAAMIFLGMAGLEIHHDAGLAPWPGYSQAVNHVVYVVSPMWVAAAIAVFLRGYVADLLTLIGVVALIVHGSVTRIGGSDMGYAYFGLGIIAFFLAIPTRHRAASGKLLELPRPHRASEPNREPEEVHRRAA